jgi:putative MATE family efflux protein
MTSTAQAMASVRATDPQSEIDPRTRRLLEAPILPLLIRLAWPNVLIMVAQASAGLIETWWVAKLGTGPLAAMALVFPMFMLMGTLSGGALGGAISSAVARALGAGRRQDADALLLHAAAINIAFALGFSALFLLFGGPIYRLLGGKGAALEAALAYSNVVFAGNIFIWLMNGLASVIRGTGNMLYPAAVICIGVVFLIPVSPLLIFGFGPIPPLGIIGGGLALVFYYVMGTLAMAWYIVRGRSSVRFQWAWPGWARLGGIMRVGALSAINTIQTNAIVAGTTALVAMGAGVGAVAGFGTGVRLEYLLIPLIFGIGAPLVAMVGTNMGAGQHERALRITMLGAGLTFLVTETVGLAAALWSDAWLTLFSTEPDMIRVGSAYLHIVGPAYGFFGLGLSLHFASQGAGRMLWPIIGSLLRTAIALGGGWIALLLTGSLSALFVALGVALVAYGLVVFTAVRAGVWRQ